MTDPRGATWNDPAIASLVETVADGLFIADENGRFVLVNDAACVQVGRTREQLLGMHVATISAREGFDFPWFFERLKRERRIMLESTHRRGDGGLVPVELNVTLVDWRGRPALLGIARDFTARKAAEAAQKRLEEQLHQSMKMEAVGRLAGGIAHDFNNLLTVIAGCTELLLSGRASGEHARTELAEIKNATKRAATLTRQLLAFSRKQVIEPRLIDLEQLVLGASSMFARLIGEDITLSVTVSGEPIWTLVDPGQLEQVLMNLVVNARDAMPGGGRLFVDVSVVDVNDDVRTGRHAVLTVSDTGHGIAPDHLEHIFEPFFTTKGTGQGTGLGLSMAYGVISQANGFITVDSREGGGATFRVHLPLADAPVVTESVSPPSPKPRGRETILLVEDDELVRGMVGRFLRQREWRVIEAGSAEQALRLLEGDAEVDLLLTDVVLPGMNGRQLQRAAVALRPRVRTIFVSGYSDRLIADEGLVEPGVVLVHKPFELDVLAATLRRVLDER